MLYIKRFIFGIFATLYYIVAGLFIIFVLVILGYIPSIFIGYVITGKASAGPDFLIDNIITGVFNWPKSIEPKETKECI